MTTSRQYSRLGWAALLLIGILLNLFAIPESQARMGGGHSYSGGSSRSSGSSSRSSSSGSYGGSFSIPWGRSSSSGYASSGGVAAYPADGTGDSDRSTLLIEIIILILVIYVLLRLLSHNAYAKPASAIRSRLPGELTRLNAGMEVKLQALKARDANFSQVLLLDFACLLYHKYYSFRGTDSMRLLAPYLSQTIGSAAQGNVFFQQQRIHDIVIGKAKIINIMQREQSDLIQVEFETNFTVQYRKTQEQARLVNTERWLLGRQSGLLSPPPEQMRTLSCPSCGAPADFSDAGECPYCRTFIQAGEKQWLVVKMDIIGSQPFQTEAPGGYVEEAGTNYPTYLQNGLERWQAEFLSRHGLPNWPGFFQTFCEQVVKPYFLATYSAWSQGDWKKARHLVSDRLYEANGFWMAEYARQGWQNRLDNIQIQRIEIARLDLDRFYDALTVRVFASCLDYTVDRQGKLIGGSAKKPRPFSEYWTFIRAAGAEKITDEYDLKSCPSCGAPADKVGQAGVCAYCGSKISEGRFSWVLAVITQDEVYEG